MGDIRAFGADLAWFRARRPKVVANETVGLEKGGGVPSRYRWACTCGKAGTWASAAQAKNRGDAHLSGHLVREWRDKTARDAVSSIVEDEIVIPLGSHTHYNCECRPTEVRDAYWTVASAENAQSGLGSGVSGKWLVFAYLSDHDAFWARIREATAAGRLGPESKAATALDRGTASNANSLVTCVYTADHRDLADVGRVLAELRQLGISGRLNYKADSDTMSGKYGAGASIYTSDPGSFEFCEPRRRRSPARGSAFPDS